MESNHSLNENKDDITQILKEQIDCQRICKNLQSKEEKFLILQSEIKKRISHRVHKLFEYSKTKIMGEFAVLIDQYWIISEKKKSITSNYKALIRVKLKDNRIFMLKIEEFPKSDTKSIEAALNEFYIGKHLAQFSNQTIEYYGMCEEINEGQIRIEMLCEYAGVNLRENVNYRGKALGIISKIVEFLLTFEVHGICFFGIKPEDIFWNESERIIKFKCSKSTMAFFNQPDLIHKPLKKNDNLIKEVSYFYAPPELGKLDAPESIIPQKVVVFSFGIIFAEFCCMTKEKQWPVAKVIQKQSIINFWKI